MVIMLVNPSYMNKRSRLKKERLLALKHTQLPLIKLEKKEASNKRFEQYLTVPEERQEKMK